MVDYLFHVNDDYIFNTGEPIQKLRRGGIFVPGSGSHVPRAIFLIDQPGATDSRFRRPMSGKTGSKFDDMLEIAGILRSDVYITNVVKFQTPSDRAPNKAEIEESLPYLFQELKIVSSSGCRLLVTMGDAATDIVADISHLEWIPGRGNTVDLNKGWTWFEMNHPRLSLAGKNDVQARIMQSDLNKIGNLINERVE